MKITIQLDRENDQLYVLFRPEVELKGVAARTVKLTEEILVDLDAEGTLVGLDIAEASRFLGIESLDDISVAVAFSGSKKGRK